MRICIYVSIYIYMDIHIMHIYIYTHTHIYIYMYIFVGDIDILNKAIYRGGCSRPKETAAKCGDASFDLAFDLRSRQQQQSAQVPLNSFYASEAGKQLE